MTQEFKALLAAATAVIAETQSRTRTPEPEHQYDAVIEAAGHIVECDPSQRLLLVAADPEDPRVMIIVRPASISLPQADGRSVTCFAAMREDVFVVFAASTEVSMADTALRTYSLSVANTVLDAKVVQRARRPQIGNVEGTGPLDLASGYITEIMATRLAMLENHSPAERSLSSTVNIPAGLGEGINRLRDSLVSARLAVLEAIGRMPGLPPHSRG